jgi:hypothetical protein
VDGQGLRPRTIPQVLDGAVGVLRRHASVMVTVVLVVFVPVHLAAVLLQRAGGAPATEGFGTGGLLDALGQSSGGAAASLYASSALRSLALAFAGVALAHVVAADALGQATGAAIALKRAARRFPAVLVAWLFAKTLIILGTCLALVGGVALLVSFSMTSPVIALETAGPVRALRRSWHLTATRWASTLGLVLLVALVSTLVAIAMAALPLLVGLFGPLERIDWLLTAIGQVLASLIVVPLVGGSAALWYLDLRVRAEGIDLRMDLDALAPVRRG